MKRIAGVYANLPTAWDDSGEKFDAKRQEQLINYLLDQGVYGFACLLSSGEYAYTEKAEKKQIIKEISEIIDKRVPLLAGVSSISTRDAIDVAQSAEACGVRAVMVMPWQYWPLTEAELVDHYLAIAKNTGVDLGIYDNPILGGARIAPRLYRELYEKARVRVSKDGTGLLSKVIDVLRETEGKVAVMHGNHTEMLYAYLAGAAGVCTAIATVFPRECVAIYDKAQRGDWAGAKAAVDQMDELFRFFKENGLSRCVKAASKIMGRNLGEQRRPLTGLDEQKTKAMEGLLKKYRYID